MHFEIMVTEHRGLESDSAQGLSPGGDEGVKREIVGNRRGLMVECPIRKVLHTVHDLEWSFGKKSELEAR